MPRTGTHAASPAAPPVGGVAGKAGGRGVATDDRRSPHLRYERNNETRTSDRIGRRGDDDVVGPAGAAPAEKAVAAVPTDEAVPADESVGRVDRPIHDAPWAPLGDTTFRWFWLASLVSNLGTWVHEVGAGWLMTSLDATPAMVSAVRVAIATPMMLLAIPAGALIDRLERKTVLVVTTAMLLVVTITLTAATFADRITSWGLLAATFAIGASMVGHMLAWQATVPGLVPREQLPRAVALGSVSFNLARAVGPAAGGLLIAAVGCWAAFGFNAASFAAVAAVLFWWRPTDEPVRPIESFRATVCVGLRYCFGRPAIRAVLVHLVAFVAPASALWALLPLYVREYLGWNAEGYGVLVAMLGVGAVTAAVFLHRLHRRLGYDATVLVTGGLYAASLGLLSAVVHPAAAVAGALVMGAAWMMTLTTLNSVAQLNLPSSIRGRGMSVYYTAMSFSMAAGALVWGWIAEAITLPPTLGVAAAVMVVGRVGARALRLEAAPPTLAEVTNR